MRTERITHIVNFVELQRQNLGPNLLRDEYLDRVQKNPSYSLRAFARTIDISPSVLSRIFKGEKSLSIDRAVGIAKKLDWDSKKTNLFIQSIQYKKATSLEARSLIQAQIQTEKANEDVFFDLAIEQFRLISEWFHLPVLECLSIQDFDFNVDNVSKLLKITKIEARSAIERLERLELIVVSDGKYVRNKNHLLVNSKTPNEALRKYHHQMLQLAMVSVDQQTPDEKNIAGQSFAFDEELLPKAKKLTDRYLQAMLNLARKSKNRKSVYQLHNVLFRLSTKQSNQNRGKK